MVLTGEAGVGKTTLLMSLGERLRRERVEFGLFLHPRMSAVQFYEMLAYDLGLECLQKSKTEVLRALNRLLLEQAEMGRTTALLIDEAHHLEREVLEEIQLLEGLRSRKERLLQIVLAGRPELERNLEADSLAGLRQQIVIRCRLEAASEEARPVTAGEG
jgi:general secretion pathway protein A